MVGPVWAVVAGRMGSSRLPGKTLAPLAGRPSLAHIIDRLKTVPELDGIVVATVDRPLEDPIRACAAQAGVACFSGDEDDVLGRTLEAARAVGAEVVVQVTGDCPMVDPAIVSRAVRTFAEGGSDYVSSVLGGETWPVGCDVEVFATRTLAAVDALDLEPSHREHVSLYIYEHPAHYALRGIQATGEERRPDLRMTLDTADDLRLLAALYDALWRPGRPIALLDAIRWCDAHPDLAPATA